MIEGIAAVAVVFLLLVLVVEAAFLVTARNAASAAVAAGARRLAFVDASIAAEIDRVVDTIENTVPGVSNLEIDAEVDANRSSVTARFRWLPPGPDLLPVTVTVTGSSPRIAEP